MKPAMRKFVWTVVNLLLVSTGAYLIALAINSIVAVEVWTSPDAIPAHDPVANARSARPPEKSNRIIVERNYFGSSLAEPDRARLAPEVEAFLRRIEPHLERETIARLFAAGGAFTRGHDESDRLTFHCHIVEGSWCWFVEDEKVATLGGSHDPGIENETHRVPADLAGAIVGEVGAKHLEHARNNGATIRCSAAKGSRQPPVCEIDWGWGEGWQGLAVR